jgi:predicted RNase H-like nuclease (RuvC/YqgF family)
MASDTETPKNWNPEVPIETLFKWKSREREKLKRRVENLEATVKALRNNIRIIIDDPEARHAVRQEAIMRMMIKERNALDKKLHQAYVDREELIIKLNRLKDHV